MRALRFTLPVTVLGLALSAVAVTVNLTSDHGSDSSAVVASVSILLPLAAAIIVFARYPDRRLPWILVAIGAAYFVRSLGASDNQATYSLARALGQFGEPLLIWLMLAFPSGHLGSNRSRALVLAAFASIVLLWWPVVAFTPEIPLSGTFACTGSCPQNVLHVAGAPGLGDAFTIAFRASATLLLLATALVLAARLHRASPMMRQLLAPVLMASLLRVLAVATFVALGSPNALVGALVATYWAIPVSILVGLARGRAYSTATLQRLVSGLRFGPGPAQLRSVLSRSLEDPSLEIGYWMEEQTSYASSDGLPFAPAGTPPETVATEVRAQNGRRVALLAHDAALLDHAELLESITAVALIGLERNQLEARLAAEHAGTISAVHAERRRIEQNLHDGAQQRLIALRMKLSVLDRIVDRDPARSQELLRELGSDIDATLHELRLLAHGEVPEPLRVGGLVEALQQVRSDSPVPIALDTFGRMRYPDPVETAVYFCCLEAVQNVAKHAGGGSRVSITLRQSESAIDFSITDDGVGFEGVGSADGSGTEGMQARIESVGGSLEVRSGIGAGTVVAGSVPIRPASAEKGPGATAGTRS